MAPPLDRPVGPWWPEYLMSTRTNETSATDELMAYAEANAGRGDDCGRLARMVVDRHATAAAPVFEVGHGWLEDPAKYGRGTQLYARPCTCSPDDKPPQPCARRYALTDCREADRVWTNEVLRLIQRHAPHIPMREHGNESRATFLAFARSVAALGRA